MALGRGLGEILGEVEAAYGNNIHNGDGIEEIVIGLVEPNPYQPRKIFDEEKLQELSQSILACGLLQPIVVIEKENGYILVAGERRLRASKLAGLEKIRAIILDIDEKKLREYALIENIQRDDLNILEIAYSYAGLLHEYGMTHEELANVVHKSRSSITNILRLLTLSVYVQHLISANKISHGHAKLMVGLKEEEQRHVADSIVGQRLSVRETEALVKNLKIPVGNDPKKSSAKFKIDPKKISSMIEILKQDSLDVKLSGNIMKIVINSNDDINNLIKYFKKS